MIVAPRVFEDRDFPIDPKSVFVVMPLTKELKKNVLPIFKKAASETKLGLQVKTSEMDWTDGDKVKKIWEQLNSASYVVVDCTDHNPNVFYELGIAHTLGKLTYLCARNRTDLSSFDIRNIHSKAYNDFNYDSMNELKKDLKNWFLKANKEFAL